MGRCAVRADVVRSALRLLDDGEVWVPGEAGVGSIPMCRLDEIGEIGPDRRRLVDGFDETTTVTAYPMIKGHDTDERTSFVCQPDHYLSPLVKPKGRQKPGYGQHLWQQSGRLLIAEGARLDTARVLAMTSTTNVLSNVWWPVKVDNPQYESVLAVWLNSSVGLLTTLTHRTSTEGGWVGFKKTDLKGMPVLDPRQLSGCQLKGLSDLFDDWADSQFERLPQMTDCPARTALDEGLSEILGLPDLSKLRVLLASEPVVCNRGL